MPGVLNIFTTQSTLYVPHVIPVPRVPLEEAVSCYYLGPLAELLDAQPGDPFICTNLSSREDVYRLKP